MSSPFQSAVAPEGLPGRLPRLGRGLAVVPGDGGIVIEGSARRHHIAGPAVTSLMPALLPDLDGKTDVAALAERHGLARDSVHQVLVALDECDALEWVGPDTREGPTLADHVTGYLSRIVGATVHECVEDIASALHESVVLVVDSGPLGSLIAADLAESGVGEVRTCSEIDAITPADVRTLTTAPRSVAVVRDADGDFAAVATLLVNHDVSVLRYTYGGVAEIGPVFDRRWTACPRCLTRHDIETATPSGTRRSDSDDVAAGIATGLVTAEILAMLAHLTPPNPPTRLRRICAPELVIEAFDVIPETDCDVCGPAQASSYPLTATYERYMRWRSEVLAPGTVRSVAGERRIAAMTNQRNWLPPGPRRRFGGEVDRPSESSDPRSSSRVDATMIADLLRRTAGRRASDVATTKRWAPTGGNLASTQLYVATARDLLNLPGTVFKYDDIENQVVSLHTRPIALKELLRHTDLEPSRVEAVVFFVADVGRLAKKYGDFALRLAHLDAGCATLQLSLVVGVHDLNLSFASCWGPELSRALELDTPAELITAVAGVVS